MKSTIAAKDQGDSFPVMFCRFSFVEQFTGKHKTV